MPAQPIPRSTICWRPRFAGIVRGPSVVPWLPGARPLCRRASAGTAPADVPPEESIEGIFLAIRNAAGKNATDLTNPEVAERFRKDWTRLADCLLLAAAQGVNPLKTSPVAGRSSSSRNALSCCATAKCIARMCCVANAGGFGSQEALKRHRDCSCGGRPASFFRTGAVATARRRRQRLSVPGRRLG